MANVPTQDVGKTKITIKGTTTVIDTSCQLNQICIAVENAGTAWTMKIQDKATIPFVIVPTFTMIVPADPGPIIIPFDWPLYMDGGIDIITAGTTAGVAYVWMI
jgi:hypothetical protein